MIDYNNFYLILSIIPIPILSRHSGDCSAIRTQNSVTTKKHNVDRREGKQRSNNNDNIMQNRQGEFACAWDVGGRP
jgi:hypothetical protein